MRMLNLGGGVPVTQNNISGNPIRRQCLFLFETGNSISHPLKCFDEYLSVPVNDTSTTAPIIPVSKYLNLKVFDVWILCAGSQILD
jgi:hypothetical protein